MCTTQFRQVNVTKKEAFMPHQHLIHHNQFLLKLYRGCSAFHNKLQSVIDSLTSSPKQLATSPDRRKSSSILGWLCWLHHHSTLLRKRSSPPLKVRAGTHSLLPLKTYSLDMAKQIIAATTSISHCQRISSQMWGEIEYNYVVLLLFKGAAVGYYLLLLLLMWKENVAGDGR